MKYTIQEKIDSYVILEDSTFDNLLLVLNKKLSSNYGSGFALVTNSKGVLTGVVEDSDLRKFLSKNSPLELQIKYVMRKDFIFVTEGLTEDQIINSVVEQMGQRGWYTSLPVKVIPITKNGKPVGIMDLKELESMISQKTDRNIVVGLGYVGLTLAVSLAESGRNVYGIDSDALKISDLTNGKSHILEPGIEKILNSRINKNLFVSQNFIDISDLPGLRNIYFICVGTPLTSKGTADLSAVMKCIKDITKSLKTGDTIVMRSTVPVGTGQEIIEQIQITRNWKVGTDFHYISAPERTVEGNALKEIRELPQVISGATEACLSLGLRLFQNLSNSVTPLDRIESSEMVKIMGNAYRDYVFGFSNFLISICQQYNLDLNLLIDASNRGYPRSTIPVPSPGVGGPCLTKDPYFFFEDALSISKSPVIAARKINELIPKQSVKFIKSKVNNLKDFNCLVMGIAFKGVPETNDYRNSPSVDFIQEIKAEVKSVDYWDCVVKDVELEINTGKYYQNKKYNFYAILNNSPKNLEFFTQLELDDAGEKIIIYDPWRQINPNFINLPSAIKTLNYFSLSHHAVIQN
jgi:UDP-N-acetyl-D-mannosaminuronic acid dehydrogenase